ncbi:MAG: hypothetical protein ACRC8A_19775 [Microcoleaceae cyanobacterium]
MNSQEECLTIYPADTEPKHPTPKLSIHPANPRMDLTSNQARLDTNRYTSNTLA